MSGPPLWAAALSVMLLAASCGKPSSITVGSKDGTEQIILGEIVAQHLEHRLDVHVERRLGLGSTLIVYQALLAGDVDIYPEYTGLIESEILKEQASPDPQVVFERARAQMRRVALSELLDPLGFDNPSVAVVRSAGAPGIRTLSEAAHGATQWKLAVSPDFLSRPDGLPALGRYHLPMSSAPRSMDRGKLYGALEKGDVTMIASRATDGQLNSPGWQVLQDDLKVFPAYQACLLVRQEKLAEPKLRAALGELSGKVSAETMRKLNTLVDVEHQRPGDVATEFLTQLGLR